jgi:hypothetical protein
LFDATEATRGVEESAVHDTTELILRRAREPGLIELQHIMVELGSCLHALDVDAKP